MFLLVDRLGTLQFWQDLSRVEKGSEMTDNTTNDSMHVTDQGPPTVDVAIPEWKERMPGADGKPKRGRRTKYEESVFDANLVARAAYGRLWKTFRDLLAKAMYWEQQAKLLEGQIEDYERNIVYLQEQEKAYRGRAERLSLERTKDRRAVPAFLRLMALLIQETSLPVIDVSVDLAGDDSDRTGRLDPTAYYKLGDTTSALGDHTVRHNGSVDQVTFDDMLSFTVPGGSVSPDLLRALKAFLEDPEDASSEDSKDPDRPE